MPRDTIRGDEAAARQGKAMRCDAMLWTDSGMTCHVCLLRPLCCVHVPLYSVSHTRRQKRPYFSLVSPKDSFSQLSVFIIDDHSTVLPSIHPSSTQSSFRGASSLHHQTLSLKSRPPAPHGAPTIHVPSHCRLHNILLLHCPRQHNIKV